MQNVVEVTLQNVVEVEVSCQNNINITPENLPTSVLILLQIKVRWNKRLCEYEW